MVDRLPSASRPPWAGGSSPRLPISYIPIEVEFEPRPHAQEKECPFAAAGLSWHPSRPARSLPRRGTHVVLRLGLALDHSPQGRGGGRCPAALGALLLPAGGSGPQETPARPPP